MTHRQSPYAPVLDPNLQKAAAVLMDTDGAVRAMAGGRELDRGRRDDAAYGRPAFVQA